jgi:hypothetical protein
MIKFPTSKILINAFNNKLTTQATFTKNLQSKQTFTQAAKFTRIFLYVFLFPSPTLRVRSVPAQLLPMYLGQNSRHVPRHKLVKFRTFTPIL